MGRTTELKPFGLLFTESLTATADALCGRLEFGSNDPSVTAQCFVNCVRQIGGTLTTIRADEGGTENASDFVLCL